MDTVELWKEVEDFTGFGMNRRRLCRGLSIFLIMALLLVSFAYQVPCALAAQEDKEYTAGVPANFPPQYQVDEKTGKPYGFAIDVMDEAARRSGIKVRYVVYGNFSDVMVAMQKGEIDLIPNVGITDERKNYTDFTAPVETFHIHIFVRSTTNGIKKIDDLAGRKVAVVAENQGYFIMKARNSSQLLVFNSMEEALMSLISGNADAMVYPEPPLLLVARQSGIENRIKTTGDALAEIKRSIGVRKGQPELYNKLDEAVKAFILAPEYEKLYSKWYGKPEPYWNTRRVLMVVGITIALAAVIFFVFHYFSLIRLNRKLRESEQKYRDLYEEAPNIYFVVDRNNKISRANKHASNALGYPAEKLIGMNRIDLFADSPFGKEKVENIIKLIYAGEENISDEVEMRRADGSNFWVILSLRPLKGKKGDLLAYRSIAVDISDRKLAEEACKVAEERYRILYENTPTMNFTLDTSGNVLSLNNFAVEELGYQADELIGRSVLDIFHEEDKPALLKQFEAVLKNPEKVYEWELRKVHKEGHIVWVREVSRTTKDEKGNTVIMIACQNITEHRHAEEKLRDSEENYRNLYEEAPNAYFSVGADGKIIKANRCASEMLGFTRSELLGKPVLELYADTPSGKTKKTKAKEIFQKFITGKEMRGEELEMQKKDGSTVWVALSMRPVEDESGKVIASRSIAVDITERKLTEEIRIEKERLEYATKAKSDFLASMSHELRTPLNAVLGFSQLMAEGAAGELNEKQKHYIDNIQTGGNFLLNLINDILDLSKVESGKIELKKEKLSIPITIDETLTLIKEKAMKHNIVINKEIDPDLDFIDADKGRVKQILFNLLSNAVKFSKGEGGTVIITVKKVDGNM